MRGGMVRRPGKVGSMAKPMPTACPAGATGYVATKQPTRTGTFIHRPLVEVGLHRGGHGEVVGESAPGSQPLAIQFQFVEGGPLKLSFRGTPSTTRSVTR